jgi:small subunit ribosomal protein S16
LVRIRMQRMGRRHLNTFRINAIEKRVKRDGKVLENLGWYAPQAKDKDKQLHLEVDRIKHWLSVGAQPSDTMKDFLVAQGIIDGTEWKAQKHARMEAKKAEDARRAANPPSDKKKEEKKA